MAANAILFRDLPFRPGYNQVFYIERGYDQRVNDFIRCYYDDLKLLFARRGFDFYYLPFLLKEEDVEARVRYYAPYLSAKLLCGAEVQSSALARYISDDAVRRGLGPSFVFGAEQEGWGGNTWLLQLPLAGIDFAQPEALERLVEQMAAELEGCRGVMLRGRGHGQPSACGPVKMNATLRMSREESSARLSAPPEAMGCRLPEETRQVRPEPAARSGKGRRGVARRRRGAAWGRETTARGRRGDLQFESYFLFLRTGLFLRTRLYLQKGLFLQTGLFGELPRYHYERDFNTKRTTDWADGRWLRKRRQLLRRDTW